MILFWFNFDGSNRNIRIHVWSLETGAYALREINAFSEEAAPFNCFCLSFAKGSTLQGKNFKIDPFSEGVTMYS